eukprot:scaffold18317_cov129-Isochrysis_galbana.AAC.3
MGSHVCAQWTVRAHAPISRPPASGDRSGPPPQPRRRGSHPAPPPGTRGCASGPRKPSTAATSRLRACSGAGSRVSHASVKQLIRPTHNGRLAAFGCYASATCTARAGCGSGRALLKLVHMCGSDAL